MPDVQYVGRVGAPYNHMTTDVSPQRTTGRTVMRGYLLGLAKTDPGLLCFHLLVCRV